MIRRKEGHAGSVEVITSVQRRRYWLATKETGNGGKSRAVRQQHIIGCPEIRYPSHRERGQKRINHKRIYRIMRANHLLLQKYKGRPVRAHTGNIVILASNMRWCSDMFEILCWNGQKVRIAFAMDCCDREIVGYVATTGGITGDMVRDLTASCMEYRFGKVDPHRMAFGQRQPLYGERDDLLREAHGVQALHDPLLQPGIARYS